jgi:hypothetical protein
MKNLTMYFQRRIKPWESVIMAVLLVFCMGFNVAEAGNVIYGGTIMKVLPGTKLISVENFVIKNSASLDNSGLVILKKSLINENTVPNSLGNGTVECSGALTQSVDGLNVFQNLVVNNTAGVTAGGSTRVNGTLNMTTGMITLGANNLLLGPSAMIAGTPSVAVMIVASGAGELRKEFPSGFTGSFTFPVGDNTNAPEYSPVTLTFTSGTFGVDNYTGVSLVNDKYPDPNITGNYLNRYWTISQSGITSFICNATFQYVPADVTGTEGQLSCSKVNPLPWITFSLTNTVSHLLSATGIVAFSSFTGVKSDIPPVNQELQNITLASGVTNCYDAEQHLTVAGNGTSFIVENGGFVTLIAGNMISMLPGTMVSAGGYLHGYITESGNFCSTPVLPIAANHPDGAGESLDVAHPVQNQWIKIYPNPTADFVILEISQNENTDNIKVTMYNMLGKIILQQVLSGEVKHQLSLSGQPTGIYMLQVKADGRSEIAKIVKK